MKGNSALAYTRKPLMAFSTLPGMVEALANHRWIVGEYQLGGPQVTGGDNQPFHALPGMGTTVGAAYSSLPSRSAIAGNDIFQLLRSSKVFRWNGTTSTASGIPQRRVWTLPSNNGSCGAPSRSTTRKSRLLSGRPSPRAEDPTRSRRRDHALRAIVFHQSPNHFPDRFLPVHGFHDLPAASPNSIMHISRRAGTPGHKIFSQRNQ